MDQPTAHKNNFLIGVALALITVIIWSGNYVVAKGISKEVPPISLAFYRWLVAAICIIPLGWKKFQQEKHLLPKHWKYLFWVSLTGIVLFNAFIYLASHYTTAINLALIGTNAAPVFATIMAAVFLKEHISTVRIAGMVVCFAGVLFLLSQGSWQKLMGFHFAKGDVLILISAFSFAIYNTLVKRRPTEISPITFLMVTFVVGTVMMLPVSIAEQFNNPPIQFSLPNISIFLYLGIGNSVIGFLCWNASIQRIGASRTVIFASLIPIFSSIEAVIFLGEAFTQTHLIAATIVIIGLVIANTRK